ncbi:MAG: hypothetical protein H8E44_25840 [Planctomycetes bacterium]|nr:hypothetical protein [Planctomycetota bacterium]
MSEQTAETIRAAATRLDDALERGDTEAVVACFSEDCEVELLGVRGSVIASAAEVESIVGTGPVFSVLGLVVCIGWIYSRSLATFVFGLSAIVISLFVLTLIVGLHWSPGEASVPVPLILLAYEAVIVPVGLVSLHRTIARPSRKSSKRKWQFKLRSLLIVTTLAGVAAAIVRLAMQFGAPVLVTAAIGGAAATVAAVGAVVYHALRRQPTERTQLPKPPARSGIGELAPQRPSSVW